MTGASTPLVKALLERASAPDCGLVCSISVRVSGCSSSMGLATMAIAWLTFRENVDRCLLPGAAAILAGAVVLSWQGDAGWAG